MKLIPWSKRPPSWQDEDAPQRTIQRFREETDRLFDRFLTRPFAWEETSSALADVLPSLDVAEDDQGVTIRAEVPGIEAEDIDVSVSGNVLAISGQKRESTEERDENRYHCERRFGSFLRRLELPPGVDADSLSADLAKGVLTVRAKKLADARTRHVSVHGEPATRKPVAARK